MAWLLLGQLIQVRVPVALFSTDNDRLEEGLELLVVLKPSHVLLRGHAATLGLLEVLEESVQSFCRTDLIAVLQCTVKVFLLLVEDGLDGLLGLDVRSVEHSRDHAVLSFSLDFFYYFHIFISVSLLKLLIFCLFLRQL